MMELLSMDGCSTTADSSSSLEDKPPPLIELNHWVATQSQLLSTDSRSTTADSSSSREEFSTGPATLEKAVSNSSAGTVALQQGGYLGPDSDKLGELRMDIESHQAAVKGYGAEYVLLEQEVTLLNQESHVKSKAGAEATAAILKTRQDLRTTPRSAGMPGSSWKVRWSGRSKAYPRLCLPHLVDAHAMNSSSEQYTCLSPQGSEKSVADSEYGISQGQLEALGKLKERKECERYVISDPSPRNSDAASESIFVEDAYAFKCNALDADFGISDNQLGMLS